MNLGNIEYNLEIEKIIKEINKIKAKKILLQLPDGLKPLSLEIIRELKSKFKADKKEPEFFIWSGSCYGACDTPLEAEKLGFDLLVQFGHSKWKD